MEATLRQTAERGTTLLSLVILSKEWIMLEVKAPLYLATGVFRAATGVAAAPQRGANPPFATEAGQGEALRARNRPPRSFSFVSSV